MQLQPFFSDYCSILQEALQGLDLDTVEELLRKMQSARVAGRQIFILGNGGSAAAATHWVCDMGKGINTENSKRMKIMALSDNGGILTALGNDVGYDEVFSYQLQGLAEAGDLVVFLSVSGSSPNLLRAARSAREAGCGTAAIIGDYDGEIAGHCDLCIQVPSRNYGVVEDVHLILNHILSQYIKRQNELGEE